MIDNEKGPGAPPDQALAAETKAEQVTGFKGPGGWWRLGLLLLVVLIAVLLIGQMMGGGANTNVISGTPVTAP